MGQRMGRNNSVLKPYSCSRAMLILFVTLLAFVPLVPSAANAQVAGGSVTGTVRGETGLAMPGVRVSISDVSSSAARTVTTDTDGFYNLPDLPPGNYEMKISAPGFVTEVWTDLNISAGAERAFNIVMRAGNPEQVVRIVAPPALVSSASSTVGGNVNASTVRDTPLNGRDWAQLATLQAGVTGVQANGGNTDRGFGAAISISGSRPDQNSYRLDGLSINDYSNGAPGSVLGDNLGIDAVEQVSVLGSNYPADYGRTSGGVINAVTRSGKNTFHGTVYEFLRNSALDARNFFDGPTIPAFKRNQFGGSAGGPIQKDRTFIFGDYEGLRQSLGITTVDTVPSPAVLGIGTGSTGGPGPSTFCSIPQTLQQSPPNGCAPSQIPGPGQPGAAPNPDPVTHIDTSVLQFLRAFYPLPNGPLLGNGDTGIFTFAAQDVTSENYFTVRVDRKFSEKDSFSGTYMRDNSKTVQPGTFGELLTNVVSRRQVITLHEQHIFNPSFLNAAQVGFSRAVGIEGGVSQVLNPLLLDHSYAFIPGGFAGGIRSLPGVTNFSGVPGTQGGLSASKSLFWNSFQGGDDAFLTRGKHALQFGVQVERMQDNQYSISENGSFRFDSLSQFLTNRPHTFSGNGQVLAPDVGMRETLFGAYVQDDVRLQKNLTFNVGLRYEMVTVPTEAHNRISVLRSLTDPQPVVGSRFFQNPTLRNFEPRLGFAWNPKGGKNLLRGGFGIFDVLPLPYEFTLSFQRAVPLVQTIVANVLPPGSFPTGAYQQFSGQSNSGLAAFVEQNPKRNYVMQWNLSVARELSSTLAVTLGYVGSRGVHQPYRMDNIDMVLPTLTSAGYLFPSPLTSQTLNPNFGRINATLWQANSFYDAMQADVTKRVSHGFEFHGAYTWGKSIDTLSATVADDAFPNGLFNQLFFDQRTTRGLSDFNVAQTFVLSFTWEVPGPASDSKFPHWALAGWQLGGLYKLSTGQPFTPILGGDVVGMKVDQTSEPPDRLAGPGCDTLTNSGNPNHFIKTECLAVPVPGNRWGNLGRNTLIGPGLSKLDFSVFKNNYVKRISENFNAQFRAEFFNILNHANFASPTDNLTVFDQNSQPIPSAGLITSTQTTSRQIQFALKLIW
ncbi:MAG: TonB-dependent receptor plug [Candidatus Acidoferrum typicum]|nr:TonB-dependent receptor plug [Candidatus Acidoferrum typicum]